MNFIEYRGEKIGLAREFPSYEAYTKAWPRLDAAEQDRVVRLVVEAPIAREHEDATACVHAVGAIAFPGFGQGVCGGSAGLPMIFAQSIEVPLVDQDRVFVFRAEGSRFVLIDDFVAPSSDVSAFDSFLERDGELLALDADGEVLLSRRPTVA